MAWLQNLADKAEDLLNKVDKTAATVLSETNKPETNTGNITIDDSHTRNNKNSLGRSQDLFNNSVDFNGDETSGENSAAIRTPEKQLDTADFGMEKQIKNDASSSKSSSLHDSFLLYDETQNFLEKIRKLEDENMELNKQLLNLQHLYSELKNDNVNLQNQIENSNILVEKAQSEMEQYKIRAQRILKEKEQLIQLNNQNLTSEDSNRNILSNYSEELKRELEFQQNKNSELTETVKKLNQEIHYLQQQINNIQNATKRTNDDLQQNLVAERKIRLIAEEECRNKSNELHQKIQELVQQINLNRNKDNEIKQLKDTLKQRVNTTVNSDYESRIKSLTDTLMIKQNNLETVTTERNALRIQLEKLENEHRRNLAQSQKAQVRVINIDSDEAQLPQFMRVSPLDAGVTKRVKNAYSTLDAVSVRTGRFLRRYPLARVFVFCYMIVLQLWVLFLLFLYAPSTR